MELPIPRSFWAPDSEGFPHVLKMRHRFRIPKYPAFPFRPLRGTLDVSGEHVQTAPQADGQPGAGVSAPAGHPLLLLGHAGRIYCGFIGTKAVYCLSGRFHYYEGYSPDQVVFAVRALHCAGVKTLIVTNAAGGINTSYSAGEFMLISDHINFLPNPLVGRNNDSFGPRFPDMTYAYDPLLRKTAKSVAENLGIKLHEGVYIAVPGPSYETPAEIRAFRTLGADAVGMSTVPEVIAANHCGMRVLGISLITNMAAGVLERRLTGEEVIEAGKNAASLFERLMTNIIERINE